MDATEAEAELEFLLRSDNRTALLGVLDEAGPLDRYELEDRVDASRRTITRILDTLSERGYLSERDGAYALSAFGTAIAEAYGAYRETAALVDRYRPLLRHLDSEVIDLDPSLLRGAELTVATDTSPYALLDRVLQLREGADRIYEMAPSVEAKSVGQLAERVEDGEAVEVEVILPPAAVEDARTHPEYAEAHRTIRTTDGIEMYVYPEPFSVVLGIVDGTAVLGVSVDGRPHALVESARPAFVEWAERSLDSFRREAAPIEER
jgi:predicted transcriptional regulator